MVTKKTSAQKAIVGLGASLGGFEEWTLRNEKEYDKLKPKYERVTATIVLDWLLKEIQIPIFSSSGVNQIKKIERKRKEWKV